MEYTIPENESIGRAIVENHYDRKILARKYLALLERIITNNEN